MLNLHIPEYKRIELIAKSSPEYISFAQGAVRVGGTPPEIKADVSVILKSDQADYYEPAAGIPMLRKKLAAELSEKFSIHLNWEQIIITHGAIGGITTICLALLNSGDEVLLPSPTYPSYANVIRFCRAEPTFVHAFHEDDKGWSFDFDAIKRSVTVNTRMMIIPNPSNPCGFCLGKQQLDQLMAWCEERGIFLIVDEVYDHFIYEGESHSVTPSVLTHRYVLRTGSFSKDYAMSGWRVGFIVAPEHLVPLLKTIQDGALCCASVVGQFAAYSALEQKHLVQRQVNLVRLGREIASEMLKPLIEAGVLTYTKPQAGIFMFLKTQELNSEYLVNRILEEAKVALVPGKDFGLGGEAYIRLCFAREEAKIVEGIKRIQKFMIQG